MNGNNVIEEQDTGEEMRRQLTGCKVFHYAELGNIQLGSVEYVASLCSTLPYEMFHRVPSDWGKVNCWFI